MTHAGSRLYIEDRLTWQVTRLRWPCQQDHSTLRPIAIMSIIRIIVTRNGACILNAPCEPCALVALRTAFPYSGISVDAVGVALVDLYGKPA